MKKKLEICCYTVESAIIAEAAGADRIELCDNYSEGGTTPSFASIEYCLEKVRIPVNVIVRPRGGDFLYSSHEFEIIKRDAVKIKELGANGIVAGFLKSNGEIDTARTEEIAKLVHPLEFTFHRAFDMCNDPFKGLEKLKKIGLTRILSSGTMNNAIDGVELLSEIVKRSENKIIIMPGSGINETNLKEIVTKTDALEYHSSAKSFGKSQMNFINTNIYMGADKDISEFQKITVSKKKIEMMVEILKSSN